jgi:hypothetical protein
LTDYGFCAEPGNTLQQNFNNTLNILDKAAEYLQPTNLAFHNLCKHNKLPTGSRALLGLNLKFCLASNTITNDINKTVLKLARSIRTRHYLMENGLNDNKDYEKQIYITNTNWHPPPAPWDVEQKITDFEKALKQKQQLLEDKYKNLKVTNLTPSQTKAMKQLKTNNTIIIKPTDKNLGPAVMDTLEYIQQVLKEHLLTDNYVQLTQAEAQKKIEALKVTLKNLISNNANSLPQPELIYFKRSLPNHFRLPIFYGLPKVHKMPVSLRPVVSKTNSLLAVFSIWLDYKMKSLLPLVRSYIKNSIKVIKDLRDLFIPQNALLFSTDAVSMYTNIDTASGLQAMRQFLHTNLEYIPIEFPKEKFLKVLEIVMSNNVFTFGNTYWQQLSGTAMGTPAACAHATITYGHFENSTILPSFQQNLMYYKRYIDDIFGIWVPTTGNNQANWQKFVTELDKWGKLKWKVETPSSQTVFLDLNIRIQNNKNITSTYQKNMNLYLYIPPLSAHPPSCFKGLIAGEIRRYWLQNSPEDFKTILVKFIERLLARGHKLETLKPVFAQAALSLDSRILPSVMSESSKKENILYIHRTYHPKGIQSYEVRQLYDQILKPSLDYLDYDHMTIALSRPRNLRDTLTCTALRTQPNLNVQNLVNELK